MVDYAQMSLTINHVSAEKGTRERNSDWRSLRFGDTGRT